MKVLIVLSWGQRELHQFEWLAPSDATVADTRHFLETVFPEFQKKDPAIWHTAIWGKPVELTQALQENDRIEWLRGLRVDPKVARRERFQSQGRRTAGLFARQRPGAKAGY
jgi:putative ubiquitin-RnfH superfamily antitoxin RatB of RatAB toxin-antitoxin module